MFQHQSTSRQLGIDENSILSEQNNMQTVTVQITIVQT